MRKKYLALMLAVVLLLCTSCSIAALQNVGKDLEDSLSSISDSGNDYVLMVKNGYREDDPGLTYDKAFSAFFDTPRWKYFRSDDGLDIVEFTGDCIYRDVAVKARIQFVVYEEKETFEAVYLAFNEVPQDLFTLAALIAVVFEPEEDKAPTTDKPMPQQLTTDQALSTPSLDPEDMNADQASSTPSHNPEDMSASQNSYPGEILYDGKPIVNWLGSRLADMRSVFGSPDYEGVVWEGGTYGYVYGGITVNKSEYGEDISSIWGEPAAITFNGTTLDKNLGELVRLFGPTVFETWNDDYGFDSYVIGFTIQGVYTIRFEMDDPYSRAFNFWIYKSVSSTMSLRDYTLPPDQYAGDIFAVRGIIESNYQILSVFVGVISDSGVVETSSFAMPNAYRYDIRNLDYDLLFDRLTPGYKVYVIEATDEMESFYWEHSFWVYRR